MDCRGMKVNFLGDSITYGVGTARPEERYVDMVKEELGLAAARNYGVSASRIANQEPMDVPSFCQRYGSMDDDADLIVVFGGCNDYFHGTAPIGTWEDRTPDTFYGACHTLLLGLMEKYPGRPVVFLSPIHSAAELGGPNRVTGFTLEQYTAVIREVAGYYAVPMLDLLHTSGIQPAVPLNRELFCPDGTHPNGAGNRILASRLMGFLRSL